jgi:hypothetical protein
MKDYLLKRFTEPSTWMGALAIAASFGLSINETQQLAIAAFGAMLCGMPDKQH